MPRDIMLAVRGDKQLDYLLPEDEVVLPGGVVPHINKVLCEKKPSAAEREARRPRPSVVGVT